MRKVFQLLKENLEQGNDAVLVTIIASSGSAPRREGARMLVTGEGRIRGTIGGGAVELHSEEIARAVLKTADSHTEYFQLKENEVQDLGMICGGDVNVYFQYFSSDDSQNITLMEQIEQLYEAGEEFWLIYNLSENAKGNMAVYAKTCGTVGIGVSDGVIGKLRDKPFQMESEGQLYYCEKMLKPGKVYIFGGGHVSQALVPALKAVDFRCVVLEDREEFAKPELFPGAEEVLKIENSHISDYVRIGSLDYVCIMTRGHKDDLEVQAQVLMTPARYIGVIGSRHKKAGVFAKLLERGYKEQDLARITTPIGLSIGAETPAEIAVSITAQLIALRSGKS